MKKILAVARWEYVEKVKSKAFIISLILLPVISIGLGVVPGLLISQPDTESKIIGIIDQTGEFAAPLGRLLEERYRLPDGSPNYMMRRIGDDSGEDLVALKKHADSLVISEQVEGYLVIGKNVMTDSGVDYRSENVGNIRVVERLTSGVRDLIVERKLRAQGLDPLIVKELTTAVEVRTIKLSKSGEEEESGFIRMFFSAYIFMMMMFFLVATSGQLLVRSMLEEKMNRVVEVLVSSCSATDLMAGKIIGLSALGLTQIGFWAVIGVAITLQMGITLIPPLHALLLLVYFILGYLFYAAMFVTVGSPVSTEQEAQQITSYLMLTLLLPIALAMPVVQDPDSLLVTILTFIPLFTPSIMAMRIPIQMPSPVEVIVSIGTLSASAVIAIWVAGKIFRTAILAYGKRPSIRELVRLLRTT